MVAEGSQLRLKRWWRTLTLPRVLAAAAGLGALAYVLAFSYQIGFYQQFGILPSEAGRSRADLFPFAAFTLAAIALAALMLGAAFALLAAMFGRPGWGTLM